MRCIAVKNGAATGTAVKTLIQVKAGTPDENLTEMNVSFEGLGHVLVELIRQTSAGTMSALTPETLGPHPATSPNITALHTSTGEPTDDGEVIGAWYVTGSISINFMDVDKQQAIVILSGERVGLRVTSAVDYKWAASLETETCTGRA